MRHKRTRCLAMTLALVLAMLTAACGTNNGSPELIFNPPLPFIPVTLHIDLNGNISVTGDASILTPIGRFGASVQKASNMTGTKEYTLLTIRRKTPVGVMDDVYRVNYAQDVEAVLNGSTRVVVENRKVLIDATKSKITSIVIRGAQKQTPPPSRPIPAPDSPVPDGTYPVWENMAAYRELVEVGTLTDHHAVNQVTTVMLAKVVVSGRIATFYVRIAVTGPGSYDLTCGTQLDGYGYFEDRGNVEYLVDHSGHGVHNQSAIRTYCQDHRGQTISVSAGHPVDVYQKFRNDPNMKKEFIYSWLFDGFSGGTRVTLAK